MTNGLPANDPDDTPSAAPDQDAAPRTGSDSDPARAVLDGPALANEEMRRGTEELRSSEDKIAQARELADDVARRTEPAPSARPGDRS